MNHKGLRFATLLLDASHRFNVSTTITQLSPGPWPCEWYLYMLRVNLCLEAVSVFFPPRLSGDDSRSGEGGWCQLTPLSASNRKCDLYCSSLKNNLAIVSSTLLSLCPSRWRDAKNTSQWTSCHHSCRLTHNPVHLCCPTGKSTSMNLKKKNHNGTL